MSDTTSPNTSRQNTPFMSRESSKEQKKSSYKKKWAKFLDKGKKHEANVDPDIHKTSLNIDLQGNGRSSIQDPSPEIRPLAPPLSTDPPKRPPDCMGIKFEKKESPGCSSYGQFTAKLREGIGDASYSSEHMLIEREPDRVKFPIDKFKEEGKSHDCYSSKDTLKKEPPDGVLKFEKEVEPPDCHSGVHVLTKELPVYKFENELRVDKLEKEPFDHYSGEHRIIKEPQVNKVKMRIGNCIQKSEKRNLNFASRH